MQLLRNTVARVPIIAVVTVLLLVVQVSELNRNADQWAAIEQEQKHRIVAAAQLIREGEQFLSALPAPEYVPDLTVDALARLDREGQLPGNVRVTEADRLSALAYLQVTLTDEPVLSTQANPPVVGTAGASVAPVSGDSNCIDATARSLGPIVTLRLSGPASIEVLPSSSGGLGVQLRADEATGRLRAFSVVGGGSYWLNLNLRDTRVDLVLPLQGITTLCGLAPLDEEFVAHEVADDTGEVPD